MRNHWIPETDEKWELIYDWTGFVSLALISSLGMLTIIKATDKRNPEQQEIGIKLITSTLLITIGALIFGLFFWVKAIRNNRYSMVTVWEMGQTLVLIGTATLG